VAEKVWIREGIVIEGPEGETLAGSQCKACGQIFFPKAEQVCLNCLEGPLEDLPLSRKGKLCSYTVVHMPASGFQEGKAFKEGMEMEVRVGTLWEEGDKEVMGFKFAAAGG